VSAEDVAEVAQVARQEGVEVRLSAGIAETLTSEIGANSPAISPYQRAVRYRGRSSATEYDSTTAPPEVVRARGRYEWRSGMV
jgi:hypothetical protein